MLSSKNNDFDNGMEDSLLRRIQPGEKQNDNNTEKRCVFFILLIGTPCIIYYIVNLYGSFYSY